MRFCYNCKNANSCLVVVAFAILVDFIVFRWRRPTLSLFVAEKKSISSCCYLNHAMLITERRLQSVNASSIPWRLPQNWRQRSSGLRRSRYSVTWFSRALPLTWFFCVIIGLCEPSFLLLQYSVELLTEYSTGTGNSYLTIGWFKTNGCRVSHFSL